MKEIVTVITTIYHSGLPITNHVPTSDAFWIGFQINTIKKSRYITIFQYIDTAVGCIDIIIIVDFQYCNISIYCCSSKLNPITLSIPASEGLGQIFT